MTYLFLLININQAKLVFGKNTEVEREAEEQVNTEIKNLCSSTAYEQYMRIQNDPFASANNHTKPEWTPTFEGKRRFCNHSACDLVLSLLKITTYPCQ